MYLIFPHMVNAYFAFLNRFVFPLASSLATCRRSSEYGAVRRTANRLRSISKVRPPCSSSSVCLHKSGCFAAYCASRFLSAVLCVSGFQRFCWIRQNRCRSFSAVWSVRFSCCLHFCLFCKNRRIFKILCQLYTCKNRLIFAWGAPRRYAARSGRSHSVKSVFLSSTRHQRASSRIAAFSLRGRKKCQRLLR